MTDGSFKYLVKEGARNLWINRLMTFASVGVLTACLLIVGLAMLLSENVNSVVDYVGEQNEIVVFLNKENTEELNELIGQKISRMENVSSAVYVSKEEAFELQREKLGAAAALLEEKGDNPYYAYFVVKEKNLEKMSGTVQTIGQISGVEQVNSSSTFADTIVRMKRMIHIFGTAIILALVLVSLVVISNTIRASVFSRRKEINIMKYVGATDGFIRFPFMVEGLILGFISAVLAFLLIWGGYSILLHAIRTDVTVSFLAQILQSLLPFKTVALRLGLSFLGAGVLTGMLGSVLSVRNHLKV